MPAGRGPCGHVHTCRAIAWSTLSTHAGAMWPCGHVAMWPCGCMQKTIVHMVHMHAPGFFGVGEVWTMWTMWPPNLSRRPITLYTRIVYTLHFLPFLSFYCPHGPQSLFSVARHMDNLQPARSPQNCPHCPQNCKLIVYIGFCLRHVSD